MVFAAFDVDHTLIKGDSLLWLGAFLLKKRRVNLVDVPRFVESYFEYLCGSTDGGSLKASYLKIFCSGVRREDVKELFAEFAVRVLIPNILKRAKEQLQWHQNEQHKIFLLSASPDEYLEEVAKILRVDALISTRLKWRNQYFTGNLQGKNCKGKEKLSRLLEVFAKNEVDWGGSYYYADSMSDLPIFEKVGHPIVVNPKRKMKRVANSRHWAIERWDQ